MESGTNLEKTLAILTPLFNSIGINLNSKHTSKHTNWKYYFVFIFNLIWLNLDLAAAFAWFVIGIKEGKSFTELTYFAPCYTFSWLGNFKSSSMFSSEDLICDLLDEIRELERRIGKQTEKKMKTVKAKIKFLHAQLIFFNITYGVLTIAFALSSLILIAVKYTQNKVFEPILPFLTVYPFDLTFVRWLLVYLHQIWSCFVVVLYIGCADYLYFTCCTYLYIHFKLLQDDFESIIPKQVNNQAMFRGDEPFYKELQQLIQYHQALIRSVNILELIFRKCTLFNFVSSSVVICMSGFNVTTISDLPVVLTFMLFLMMSLLQIFFLCFYGDMIMKSSVGLADAVYKSQWYTADYKLGKELNIIQIRSQKPCKLTAYSFADVNLGAFTRILSRSWSYFALLKTIYTSPKAS